MKYTPNYGLKKPEQDDFYNVDDFNENADIIDEKLKEIEDGIKNIEVPVTSVNGKTGDVVLTAEDVGGAATISDISSAISSHNSNNNAHSAQFANKLDKSGGTMTGKLYAQPNTDYTTYQVRNIALSTTAATPTGNGSLLGVYQ